MRRVNIPAGTKFGKLITTGNREQRKGSSFLECTCECGSVTLVKWDNLKSGNTRSCGCQRDRGPLPIHGGSGTPEYNVWSHLKRRCLNPKNAAFKWYGGRGITVCDEWRDSFQAFFDDMGPRPSPKHSIERKDNGKGYSKENCYWATDIEQNRNRRNNRSLTFDGQSLCVSQWAEELGIPRETLQSRIKAGLSDIEILTAPIAEHAPRPHMSVSYERVQVVSSMLAEGVSPTVIARELNISRNVVYSVRYGYRRTSPR